MTGLAVVRLAQSGLWGPPCIAKLISKIAEDSPRNIGEGSMYSTSLWRRRGPAAPLLREHINIHTRHDTELRADFDLYFVLRFSHTNKLAIWPA